MKSVFRAILLLFATAACAAPAAPAVQARVDITNAWVRATVPAQRTSGAFLRLEAGSPTRLVKVTTPAAASAAIHHMTMDGGAMKMREVEGIGLAPHQPLDFAAKGYHVMLLGLKRQLVAGDTVALTLVFVDPVGRRSTQAVTAKVLPIGTTRYP